MESGTAFILFMFVCAILWFLSTIGTAPSQEQRWQPREHEKSIIDVLNELYDPSKNYWTIQRHENKYHIYITPFKGDPMFGEGYTIEQAVKDFINKYQV